jgi:hypothetical protein
MKKLFVLIPMIFLSLGAWAGSGGGAKGGGGEEEATCVAQARARNLSLRQASEECEISFEHRRCLETARQRGHLLTNWTDVQQVLAGCEE